MNVIQYKYSMIFDIENPHYDFIQLKINRSMINNHHINNDLFIIKIINRSSKDFYYNIHIYGYACHRDK